MSQPEPHAQRDLATDLAANLIDDVSYLVSPPDVCVKVFELIESSNEMNKNTDPNSTGPSILEPDSTCILELDAALARMDGDFDLLKELIQIFLDDYPSFVR